MQLKRASMSYTLDCVSATGLCIACHATLTAVPSLIARFLCVQALQTAPQAAQLQAAAASLSTSKTRRTGAQGLAATRMTAGLPR
jgi:hypothetical protein